MARVHNTGTGLLVAGLLLAGLTLCATIFALSAPERFPVIVFLHDHLGNGRTVVNAVVGVQSVRIQGSDALAALMSLTVTGTFLLVLAGIARTLISAGSRLMRGGHADVGAVDRDVTDITRRALERVSAPASSQQALPR
jgi:hypothetical protein